MSAAEIWARARARGRGVTARRACRRLQPRQGRGGRGRGGVKAHPSNRRARGWARGGWRRRPARARGGSTACPPPDAATPRTHARRTLRRWIACAAGGVALPKTHG
eukprot:4358866-Prymnesium_polylepis.3